MMSGVYSYSKDLVQLKEDPKERIAVIKDRTGAAVAPSHKQKLPRVNNHFGKDAITIPISYIIRSKIRKWLKK